MSLSDPFLDVPGIPDIQAQDHEAAGSFDHHSSRKAGTRRPLRNRLASPSKSMKTA